MSESTIPVSFDPDEVTELALFLMAEISNVNYMIPEDRHPADHWGRIGQQHRDHFIANACRLIQWFDQHRGMMIDTILGDLSSREMGFGIWHGEWSADGFVKSGTEYCVQVNPPTGEDGPCQSYMDPGEPIGFSCSQSGGNLREVVQEAAMEAIEWMDNHPCDPQEEEE
jgi:hypothetical protein